MTELTTFYTDIRQILELARGKGFSYANLYNCRQFYLKFPVQEILYTLCRELSWSHLRLIMRVDDPEALEHYCNESRAANWTVRQLERNIKSHSYQRLLSTQNQTDKDISPDTRTNAPANTLEFIKDPLCAGVPATARTG